MHLDVSGVSGRQVQQTVEDIMSAPNPFLSVWLRFSVLKSDPSFVWRLDMLKASNLEDPLRTSLEIAAAGQGSHLTCGIEKLHHPEDSD